MIRNQVTGSRTPGPSWKDSSAKEPVEVYCRLRPLNQNEVPCLKKNSSTTVLMSCPETAVNFREGVVKETLYTFSYVFDDEANQKTIFDNVALPMIDGLLHGKNGLLLTYGVTGSGKTYTMTGSPQECGILPRTLDVIFNSVVHLQAQRYLFKPDRMNGFEIQSLDDAKQEEINQGQGQQSKTPRVQRSEWGNRRPENTKVEAINEDNLYAVFVTYVEIYNNSVFDLLDESFEDLASKRRTPQSKLIREDGAKNMYVHGVTEVEVKSMEEAFEVFNKGMRNKHMAHNTLNSDSSRSHSVFTIRLVQASVDAIGENLLQDKGSVFIGQLSFVDLAGSERTSRTNNSGQRLREAGNINNSLMNLRTCLEILRENQMNGTKRNVPYRNSKLTHLFKNFFDGACVIRVIVCANPRSDDYDENSQVMKFAEMSQEVQVAKPTPLRPVDNLPSGRRRANQFFKQAVAHNEGLTANLENIPMEIGVPAVLSLASQFPDLYLKGSEDERTLKNLILLLEVECAKRKKFVAEMALKNDAMRNILIQNEQEMSLLKHNNSLLSADLELTKEKASKMERQLKNYEEDISFLKKQMTGYENIIKRLQEEVREKDESLNRRQLDNERVRQKYQNKIAHTAEKLSHQMEVKLTDQKRKLEMEMRHKDKKLQDMKRILSDEALSTPCSSRLEPPTSSTRSESTGNLAVPSQYTIPSNITTRRKFPQTPQPKVQARSAAVSNPRHRRSRSVSDDRWLEHRPVAPVPLNTVMQPQFRKRKSITKLTDVKDITNTKTSKYCLMTQEQDSEGDLETHVYKGDVVPTCGGGAQVILNDVEILKQKSPTTSPTRKRSGNPDLENVVDKCGVSVEGHPKRSRF